MATYSRVKTWSSNETLTSSDLNAEFNNIITNTNSGALNSDNVSTSAAWTWTGTHTMSTSSKLAFIDNIYLTMGSATDGDYLLRYSASNTALELSTTNADGSGTNAVVLDIQDGTDDVRIRGGFSTDNNAAPTTGLKVGGNIVSDTDSTDDLGTTSVRWANVYTDAVGDSGQTLGVKATTLSFDAAATIDTSGNNNLTLSAGTGTLVATAGDMTLFDDNNNADVSLSLGTSATEALVVQALNGGSNKTLEELRFTTKTASGTGDHGKMSFYVDEAEIATIDDGGIDLASGLSFTVAGSAIGGSVAADNITTGDGAVNIVTTSGNITLDAQANDADVIFIVDDGGSAVTALTLDGSDEGNAIFVNDVQLKSDSAVLEFGADLDTTLTHTDGTGLTLNSTNKLTFGDAASFIQQSADGTLRIDGEAIIDLNASTRVDVSGDLKVGGEVQTASIGYTDGDNAITIADGGGVTFAQAVGLGSNTLTTTGALAAGATTITGDLIVGNGYGLTVGHSAPVAMGGTTSEFQYIGSANPDASLMLGRWSNDASGPYIAAFKSRNTTPGGDPGAAADGDSVFRVIGYVDDGTAYATTTPQCGKLTLELDGTQGTDSTPGAWVFATTGASAATTTERMRITSAGKVGLGNGGDAPNDYLDVDMNSASVRAGRFTQKNVGGHVLALEYKGVTPDDNTQNFLITSDGTAVRNYIYSDGDVWTADAGILTSDERLKTNIVDASDKLADVMKLQVRNYEWIPEYHPKKVGEKKIGFIAQELETVFPSLITENDIAPDNAIVEQLYDADDDIPEGKAIGDVKVAAKDHEPTMRKSYKNAFVPILVKALQELTARVETLEAA